MWAEIGKKPVLVGVGDLHCHPCLHACSCLWVPGVATCEEDWKGEILRVSVYYGIGLAVLDGRVELIGVIIQHVQVLLVSSYFTYTFHIDVGLYMIMDLRALGVPGFAIGCLNDLMVATFQNPILGHALVLFLWNHPQILSPTPIWTDGRTEDTKQLEVSVHFGLSMTGEIRVYFEALQEENNAYICAEKLTL